MLWTISGAGAGFGIGLWAGLSAFDDAVNDGRCGPVRSWGQASVRWRGYLIGRARTDRDRPSIAARVINRERQDAIDPRLLEQVAKSIRFYCCCLWSSPPLLGKQIRQSVTTP